VAGGRKALCILVMRPSVRCLYVNTYFVWQ